MMVNDPLAIYATVIGIKLYDTLFNIAVAFGLVFLPLLFVFFRGLSLFFEVKTLGDTTPYSIKKTGATLLLSYVLPLMLFVAPTHRLDVTAITYKPVCSPTATVSQLGDTGTTYDDAFQKLDYGDIRLPLGMAFVLTGTSGLTNAAIVSLPCKTDVQAIQNTINTTHLPSALAQQVTRFREECYAKARSQLDNQQLDRASYQDRLNKYGGQADLSWIGSHVLQELYYASIFPTSPVPGFSDSAYSNPYQEYNSKADIALPEGGFPTCLAWWSDPQNGLQNQLVDLIQQHQPINSHLGSISLLTEVNTWLAKAKTYSSSGSEVTAEDVMAHGLLYDKGSESGFGRLYTGSLESSLYTGSGEERDWASTAVTSGMAQAGQGVDAVFNTVKRAEIEQEVPILQAVLMAICLALGPVMLILGGYRLQVIFSYYFILASLIAITFIEKLIHYLELSLHESMSYGVYALENSAMLYNVFTNLYLYAPMIYFMLMSISGVQAGSALRDFFDTSTTGKGSAFAKNAAAKAIGTAL
jgi:hypothetical protein